MIQIRFLLFVFLLVVWLISIFFNLIFSFTHFNDVIQLGNINCESDTFFKRGITLKEEDYNIFVWFLRTLGLFVTFIFLYIFFAKNWIKEEVSALKNEFICAYKGIVQLIKNLQTVEKIIFFLLLTFILLIRFFYLQHYYLTTDEVASFDLFVSGGPVAVISFYPNPNNHILSNLLSLLFFEFYPEPLFTMRMPPLLVGMVSTIFLYQVLLKYTNFFIASLCVSLFSFSQYGILYSIAGRGYALLNFLTFINFFSVLISMYKPGWKKLSWFLFINSGILGFYSVPTFLYPFTSTVLIGSTYYLFKKDLNGLFNLIISLLIIGIGTFFLYLPLILVSGIDALFANKYIQPLTSIAFWQGYLYNSYHTEGMLTGFGRLGKYIVGIVLITAIIKMLYLKAERKILEIGSAVLFMVVAPYVFMMLQQVYLPERTLFYKSVFFYLLVSFLLFNLFNTIWTKRYFQFIVAGILLVLYSWHQLNSLEKALSPEIRAEKQRLETFNYLKRYEPASIVVQDPYYHVYLNYYFKVAELNCAIYSHKKENQKYDFLIVPKLQIKATDDPAAITGKLVYTNSQVLVYQLAKN